MSTLSPVTHRTASLAVIVGLLVACGNSVPNPAVPLACAIPLPPPGIYPATEVPCSQRSDPRLAAMSDDGILLTSELGLPPGRYALPATASPTQLVVMFHGHQNDSCSWRNHMRRAADLGAVVVAMNYSDQEDREVPPWGFVENWGWAVRSGAADSILAAQYFMDQYPSIREVFNLGASMGGNVAGYASYFDGAVRADCSPMWDYWVMAEGVHNLTEEYTGARALAPGLEAAAQAVQEIEEENGGTLEQVPDRYAEITNTAHGQSLGYLRGAVLTHGTNDQTVPFDQSRQMADQLRAAGVPTHLYLVSGSDHVWEGSDTATVMAKALEELFRLMTGGGVSNGETPLQGP